MAGVRSGNARKVHRDIPATSSLRDGGALRGACRARPKSVSGIAILLAVRGSCLKVSSSGGSSVNETSWAISARVWTWKVLVRLMTMGIFLTSAFRVP